MSLKVSLADALADAEVFTDGDWVESKDQNPDGDVRLTQLADVGDGSWLNRSSRFLTSEKARQLRCTYLKPGDVLIARMPDPLGRSCIFPGDSIPCVTVVDVCVVRPNRETIDSRFLMHVLNSPEGRQGIAKHITGTTRQRISRTNLGKIQIPFPPLAEQKRIAAILDAADALRARRREALAQLDSLLQATFLEMFGDPVTNPMGWEMRSLDGLGEIQTGSTPPSKFEGMFGGIIPFVTPGDLRETWVMASRTVTEGGASKSRTVRRGAIFVCCIGATIGKMGKAAEPSAFNQQINAVCWGERINDDFGFEMMRFFKSKIANDGASTTLPILKKSLFQKIVVPVPPLREQTRFAAIAGAVEQQKTSQSAHLAELDTLFASLQSRAFRGEL